MSQPAAKTIPSHLLQSKAGVNAVASGSSVASAPPRSSSKRPALRNGQSTASSSAVGAAGNSSGGNSTSSSGNAHTGGSNDITNGTSEDVSSPEATAALIRRILGSSSASTGLGESTGWQEQLPTLTRDDRIDEQLYAIIAVALKEHVHKWYGKLTPDHRFTDEVINIIAHCTRSLDARARSLDWIEIVGDQLAQLVDNHITNLRAARASTERSAFASVGDAYHALNPHPAMQPPPMKTRIPTLMKTSSRGSAPGDEYRQQDEAAYRQLLVRSALAVLLPRKDMKNPTLRILVGDLIADLILGTAVAGRLCEGWMIWESIGKAVAAAKTRSGSRPTPIGRPAVVDGFAEPDVAAASTTRASKATRLERSGLLEMVSDSAGVPATSKAEDMRATKLPVYLLRLLTAVNVACIVLMRLVSLGKKVYAASSLPCREDSSAFMWHGDAIAGPAARASTDVWAGSTSASAAPAASMATASSSGGQASISSGMHLSSATSDQDYESSVDAEGHEFVEPMPATGVARKEPISGVAQAPAPANGGTSHQTAAGVVAGQRKKPILLYAGFALIDRLLQVSRRMPWLSSAFDMARFHLVFGALGAGDTNGPLDKFLYSEIERRMNSSIVPPVLLALRSAIFPSNAPAPPRTIPTVEEQLAIRRRTAEIILSCIPARLSSHYFVGQHDDRQAQPRLGNDTKPLNVDHASMPKRRAAKQDERAMNANQKDGRSDILSSGSDRDVKEDERRSLSSEAIALDQIEEMLDIFGDSYCNRHLVYEAIELVLVKLLPEIGDKSTSQLVSESIEGL